MLIRCERCSTVYELDESMLAPEGAPVQCTRCENVFVAYPPRAAGRTLVGVPAVEAPAAPPPAAVPARPQAPRPTPGPRPPVGDRGRAGATPQVYRPSAPSSPPIRPAPVIRKDQVGAFESRLRWSARWRWLAPTIASSAAVLALGAWFLLRGRSDPEAAKARTEGLALLALDDGESLDRAASRLDEAARRDPGDVAAVAGGALARIVRAQGLREGWKDAHPADGAAEPDANDPAIARARALEAAARSALDGLGAATAADPAVVRARAAYHLDVRERQRVFELAAAARARGEADAWLDLTEASVDLDGPADARDRAVVRLAALAASHPEILRARWLLARGQASLGRTTEALAAVEAVLAANARHEGARRLRERLTAPPQPPAPAPAPIAPQAEVPRRRPRTEALAPAVPEMTTSPAGDIRPLTEEPPPERPRPSATPGLPAPQPEGAPRPEPPQQQQGPTP